jgi:hypothetical protein
MTQDALNRSLGRIEGKLDGIVSRLDHVDGRFKGAEERVSRLEDRVSLNEKRWWQVAGAGSALMAATTFILRYTDWIK